MLITAEPLLTKNSRRESSEDPTLLRAARETEKLKCQPVALVDPKTQKLSLSN